MRTTYCGIFFISAAALLLEISLTRIFSVSRWYHFAFMVVSIALLGFAASGSLLNVFPQIRNNPYSPFLSSVLFSLSVVASFFISDKIEMDPYKILIKPHLLGSIALYYVLLSVPFLCAGLSTSVLLSKTPKKAGTLYGFSLAGSAAGCLLIFAFPVFGSKIILFSSLLGVVASLFFALKRNHRLISVFVLITLVFLPPSVYAITMSPYKSLPLALNYPGAHILSTEWNTISRIDIVESPLRHAPGLSLTYPRELPSQLGLTIDGNNISSLSESDSFVEYLPQAAAYVVPRKEVLIINPQGLDVATALHFEATVTVAEGNPLIIKTAQKYAHVYDNVCIQYTDGRTFLAQTNKKYDVIEISLSESLFATSVGLYGFNESYLFTKEAFQQYYDHLTDDGILVITRWLVIPPRELPRFVSIIIDTVESPQEHTFIFTTYSTTTLLVKKTPFGPEILDLEEFCREKGFDLVWAPGITKDKVNIYNKFEEPYLYQLIASQFSNNATVQKEYLFNIKTPTDDDPFFFNFFLWRKFPQVYQSLRGKWQPFFESGFMAVLILVQAIIISLLLIAAPLKKLPRERFTFYFAFIGLGFMFIEISLIQEFIFFLGQPTYSLAFVLFSVLFFSGLGSHCSQKISWKKEFLLLVLFSGFAAGGLPFLVHEFLFLPFSYKILTGLILTAPLSFFMGIPFPYGIRLLDSEKVPSAWCVNGCFSVCGSVMSIIVALSFGVQFVLIFGFLCYGAAFLIVVAASRNVNL